MNTAIYVRVSTQQQAEHGYSLETQIDACRKKAMELGAVSIKIYTDDGYSGAYLERPALDDLRDAVAQKLHDVIIIYDIDRLSRDTMHLLLLTEELEKNARLVYVNSEYNKTPEGQLFFEIISRFVIFCKCLNTFWTNISIFIIASVKRWDNSFVLIKISHFSSPCFPKN